MENKRSSALNPWKGLRAYQEGEVLYGRDEEIQSLSQYIVNNTQTVLYGRSGIGKSSILNAGVFPVVRAEGLYPVPIRLEHTARFDYVDQIAAAMTAAGLTSREIVPVVDKERESLWEFMHRQSFKAGESEVQPLLVFDQFEEIFTLQRNEKNKLEFFEQLGDLLNEVRPQYLSSPDTSTEVVPSDKPLDELDLDSLFQGGEAASDYLEHPAYHMVFALREDFLSYLERYTSFIPVMKHNRFSLQPINEEQAADIIMKPRPGLVDEEVAAQIIRKVTGRSDFTLDGIPELEVDSAVLSLYLSRLFEKKSPDADVISGELVDQFGDDIIKEFYRDSIAGLEPSTVELLEEVLLTQEGRRNNVSRADLLARGIPEPVLVDLVDNRKLLRQFSYGDDIRVELIHDILCPMVQHHIQDRELEAMKEDRKKQEALRHLENRKRNQQRARNDLDVLTIRGRSLVDNRKDFGSFVSLFDRSPVSIDAAVRVLTRGYSLLGFTHRYQHHESLDVSGLGGIIGARDGSLFSTSIEFLDDEQAVLVTKDGIGKLRLRYEGDRIREVMFNDDPFYKNGYCGIRLDYDSEGREVRRTYVDEHGNATWTMDGYAGVVREYDKEGNICRVSYLGVDGKPCAHVDGNYGFRSDYDEDGQEIRRVFVDALDAPTKVISGIAGHVFKYDGEGRLSEETNVGLDLSPEADCEGYESVRFEYDAQSRLSKETYQDFAGNPVCMTDNYSITHYVYGKTEAGDSFVGELFADAKDVPVFNKGGHAGRRMVYDNLFRILEISSMDEEGLFERSTSVKWSEDGVPSQLSIDRKVYWLRFDRTNRFVLQWGWLNEQGNKDETSRGGFGYEMERDERTGLPTAEINIDRYNQAIPDDENVFRKQFVRVSDTGEVLEERYEGIHGNPVPVSNGSYGCLKDYDQKKNLVRETYLGVDGKPASLSDCQVVYVEYRYDDEDRLVAEHYYDAEGNRTPDEMGVFGYLFEYHEHTRKVTSVDEQDRPMANTHGVSSAEYEFDDKQRTTKAFRRTLSGALFRLPEGYCIEEILYDDAARSKTIRYLDENGNLVDTEKGYAFERREYDGQGREVKVMHYAKDGAPAPDEDGECGHAVEHGDDGRSFLRISLGEKEQPLCMEKRFFDELGRDVECYTLDENGNPVSDETGYGERTIYSEEGNRFIYVNLDAEGNPMPCLSDTYTAIEKTKDELGRTVFQRYLDGQMQPVKDSTGVFGARFQYGEDGFKEICFLDEQGNPMENNQGHAYNLERRDEIGRLLFDQYFDVDHQPVLNENGVYCVKYVYGDDNRKILFLDQDEQPMLNSEKIAAIYREYDEYGRQILEIWLGLDDEPAAEEDGLCGWRKVFHEDGSVGRINLDRNLKPAPDEDGVFIRHNEYEEGVCVKETCLGPEGDPILCRDGWVSRRFLYDEEGKKIGEMFLDERDRPVADRYGNYGWKFVPSGSPTVRIMAYLGRDAKPHADEDGTYYVKKVYDEAGRLIARFDLDRHMVPIQHSSGIFGEGYEYLEDGSKLIFGLDEDGNRMLDNDGWAGQKKYEDDRGRVVRVEWFDSDNQPIANNDGDFGRETVYLDEENAKILFGLDEHGRRHYDKHGISGVKTRYLDGPGHYMKLYVDPEGKTMQDDEGFSAMEIWEDEQGRRLKFLRRGPDGSLWYDDEGFCGCIYRYVEGKDRVIKRYANLGKDGEPVVGGTGVMFYERWSDELDRLTRQLWFDADMNPVADEKGDYGERYGYVGDNEKPIQIVSLGADGTPHENRHGYATEIRVVDATGIVQSLYLDVDGNLVQNKPTKRWLS